MPGGDFGNSEIFNSVKNSWKIKSVTWIKRKREPYHIVDIKFERDNQIQVKSESIFKVISTGWEKKIKTPKIKSK